MFFKDFHKPAIFLGLKECKRKIFNNEQETKLVSLYKNNKYIHKPQIYELAEELSKLGSEEVTTNRILLWYRNRRNKERIQKGLYDLINISFFITL